MKFSERLKKLRKEKGYTQKELADAVGITPRTLINYENGRCYPKQTELYLTLASLFDVPVSYLMCEEKEEDEVEALLSRAGSLFAGGTLSPEDREKVLLAITDMYEKAKETV